MSAKEAAERIIERDGPAFLVPGKLGDDAVKVATAYLSLLSAPAEEEVREVVARLKFCSDHVATIHPTKLMMAMDDAAALLERLARKPGFANPTSTIEQPEVGEP